jgi:hypothetical protein
MGEGRIEWGRGEAMRVSLYILLGRPCQRQACLRILWQGTEILWVIVGDDCGLVR